MDGTRIVGIYLAAGKSSRMGRNKLNLPIGETFVGSIGFRAAMESQLDVTIAVTRKGDSLHWLAPFSKKGGWKRVEADGKQSDSLKAGLTAASELEANAVMVLLADQPFVTSVMINQLIAEFCSCSYIPYFSFLDQGLLKPPILIAKELFPAMMCLTGDQGARALLRGEWKGQGKFLEANDGRPFMDIDTKEDYQMFMNSLMKEGK